MMKMAKRSFKTLDGIKKDDKGLTESEDDDEEEEQRHERRVMIRVMPRERFERTSFIHYSNSTSCTAAGGGCQADECGADLKDAKKYHRRYRVCESHAKAAFVLVKGIRQRFCQQCSRFHEISKFDGTKRCCRDRLAGHNLRRRKVVQSDQEVEDVKRLLTSTLKMNSNNKNKINNGTVKLKSCKAKASYGPGTDTPKLQQ